MKSLLAILCSLLLTAATYGQSVKLPGEIRGLPGQYVVIKAVVDGGSPRWRSSPGLDEVDLSFIFPEDALSQAKGKVFMSLKPGRFTVDAWNAKGDVASEIATCIVVIGDPPPVVVVPPVVPPVIPPVTPLNPAAVKAVAPLTGFKVQAGMLSDFYAAWKISVERDTKLKTTEELRTAYSSAMTTFAASVDYAKIQPPAPKIHNEINAFLADVLTLTNGPLDVATRAKAVKAFDDLSQALKSLATAP